MNSLSVVFETIDLDIVEAFKRSLSHLDWMDQTSAKAAAEKVNVKYYLLSDILKLLVPRLLLFASKSGSLSHPTPRVLPP